MTFASKGPCREIRTPVRAIAATKDANGAPAGDTHEEIAATGVDVIAGADCADLHGADRTEKDDAALQPW